MPITRYSILCILALALTLISCSDTSTGSNPTLYDVSVSITPSGAGTITPAADSTYEAGSWISLRANANEDYQFTGWTGSVDSSANPLSLTVDQDYSLTANFTKVEKLFNVSVSIAPDGTGTISPAADSSYEEGSTIEFQANPSDGYEFTGWTGDVESSDNPLSFTVDGEYSFTANFTQEDQFYLHENGVTIRCPEAEPGEKGFVNGLEYVAVDRDLLDQRLNDGESLSMVCTSRITDMSSMFAYAYGFNGDIGSWDVSNVTDMSSMFSGAEHFDQNIGSWDVSNVKDMSSMFGSSFRSTIFNGDIGSWDVSSVRDMSGMFESATYFDADISSWNVGNVTDMSGMFNSAYGFNGDLSSWDVSQVKDMSGMFQGAINFDGDLSDWNVSNVTDMSSMYAATDHFDQDISSWDVSSVTDMNRMFNNAEVFDQDLSSWDVGNVTNMRRMFLGAPGFNSNLSSWNVSNVTDMSSMFGRARAFNSDIENWDVSQVTDMEQMFRDATSFNQDLSGWCVQNINDEPDDFSYGSPLLDEYHPVWGTCPE